jgi:hypothetical protein
MSSAAKVLPGIADAEPMSEPEERDSSSLMKLSYIALVIRDFTAQDVGAV